MESSTRQEHIRAACSFLRNPNLDSPLKEKLQFLKDKGLSELEVEEALNLALTSRQSVSKGRWNFFIVFSMCVLGYKFYVTYLEWQRSTGSVDKETKNSKTVSTKQNQNLNAKQNNNTETEVMSITEIMQRISELKKLIEYQGTRLTDEMQSLKKLLLSPEKFTAPPIIPAWQMAETDKEKPGKPDEKKKDLFEKPE